MIDKCQPELNFKIAFFVSLEIRIAAHPAAREIENPRFGENSILESWEKSGNFCNTVAQQSSNLILNV
jgi:hypothetical protein